MPQDSAASPAQRSGKRLILVLLGIVVLVLAGIWLARWWTVGRFIESTDDAYLQADSVTVAPKVSGYVTDVYVGDNAMVKAGDPLVRLDTASTRLRSIRPRRPSRRAPQTFNARKQISCNSTPISNRQKRSSKLPV